MEWGLRTSYRNYIAGPIAHGEITAGDGAVWLDGPGNAKGSFTFPDASGTLDPESATGELAFDGTVYTGGHDYGNGYILELSLTNVRLQVDGDQGTIVVDAEYRPFVGANPNIEPPAVENAEDLKFGTVDLSGSDLVPDDDGVVAVSAAPVTGVREAMEAIGWDQFYSSEMPAIQLDPLSFTATVEPDPEPEEPQEPEEPEPVREPAVEVFADDGVTPLGDAEVTDGTEIVVRGSGFDPEANVSTRPPVPAGLPAGVYVVFGRFADTWRPSEGAGSSARTVIDQRWAMTEATLDQVPGNFQGSIRGQWVELTPEGDFEAALTIGTDEDTDGSYGVYTYAAGGSAPNAAHEFAVPVTVAAGEEEPGPDENYLDWGVRQSFRTYIEGSIAHGSITVTEPATRNEDGTFRFADGSGTFSDATAELAFSGEVLFEGHDMGAGPLLQMSLANPRITVDGAAGRLVADVASKSLASGEVAEYPGVEFAELDFRDAPVTITDGIAAAQDVPATLTEDGVPAFADFYEAGAVLDPVTFSVAVDEAAPAEPAVTLSKTTDLDPYADVVAVRGEDFDSSALSDGLLVGIGPLTDNGSVPDLDPVETITPDDGSFEVNLLTEGVEPGAVLAVYTAPVDASAGEIYVTHTEISYAEARTPHLDVSPSGDLEPGQEVEITGTGFAPNRRISIAITANTATHETYGWPTGWLAHAVVQADGDGNLNRTLTVSGTTTGSGEDCTEVQCYVASFSSAQASDASPVDYRADRSQDAFVEVGFATDGDDPDPDPQPGNPGLAITPESVKRGEHVDFVGTGLVPGEEASVVVTADPDSASDGSLNWGVRESFRTYIEGNIAHGSIDVSPPASRNDDGTFRFADGHGTVTRAEARLSFAGEVHFEGHDYGDGALLQMTLSAPAVIVDGDTGVLVADVTSKSLDGGDVVEYPDVEFAELDFSAAPLTVEDGVVSATAVPATLTEDGVPAFADFYDAGQALDPVSFEAALGGDVRVELGPETVGEDGGVELTWTVPGDFPLGAATAVLTAGDVELTGEFTVELADDPGNGGDDTGSDENGTDEGTDSGDDGTDAGADGGADSGADLGGDDGSDSGADGSSDDSAADDGKDGALPDTGAGSGLLLAVVLALAAGGAGVTLLARRRMTA
nr:HtaA domain-containing protein [Phytoactinopolyspora alkaliphila]